MRSLILFLGLVLSGLVFVPTSQADEMNKETILTFNQPVEIPGTVLRPGTYVVERATPGGNPDVVQFLNKDRNHVYATVIAVPTEATIVPEKPTITFAERRTGAPEAIERWYYPGDITGEQFLYPKNNLMAANMGYETATRSVPAPSPSENQAENQPAPAPQAEQQPASGPTESAQMRNPSENQTAPNAAEQKSPRAQENSSTTTQTETQTQTTTTQRQLPQTASDLPLLLLAGTGTLLAGLGLKSALKTKAARERS